MPTPDETAKQSLYAQLAAEKDPTRFQALLASLDRIIDNEIRHARAVPDVERR